MGTTGEASIEIGGPSVHLRITAEPDGSLRIGDHILLKASTGRYEDFQGKVIRDLAILSTTPAGLARLSNVQENPGGHEVVIREFSASEEALWGPNNSLTFPGGALKGPYTLKYDESGSPTPGPGSGSELAYNPEAESGPAGHPKPKDALLFHELGHAEHNAWGINRGKEPMADGWTSREEWQTIQGGVNTPDGTSVPGLPVSPSENEYLAQRGYPYRRTSHSGWANPDGTPITP